MLELAHRTATSFDRLIHNFYKLQPGRNGKVQGFMNRLEGALAAVHQEYLDRITELEIESDFSKSFFHGLKKSERFV